MYKIELLKTKNAFFSVTRESEHRSIDEHSLSEINADVIGVNV